MRSLLFLTAVVVTGCAPPGFARLGPFQVMLLRGGPQGTMAFFQYDRAERGCQVLDPDFTATANGVEAETFRGGPSFGPCDSPLVDFAPPPSPANGMILEMSSGEDRVIVGIDELGQTIDGQLLVAPGTPLHAGDQIQIALGPGYDRVTWPPFSHLVSVDFSRQSGIEVYVPGPSASGVLDIALPAALPSGRAHLKLNWSNLPAIIRCEGADDCQWLGQLSVLVALDVAFDVSP